MYNSCSEVDKTSNGILDSSKTDFPLGKKALDSI
jgi:hypothetical protein